MSSDAGVKWRPGLAGASLAVLIAVLVVTGLGVWAVSADVHHQEHTALTQRSSEYAVVLSNRLSEVESALSVLGQISPETPQSQNIFYEAARSQVSGTTRFIAVAKPQAQGYVVVAAVGQGLPVGSHLVGGRLALAKRSAGATSMVSTVLHEGSATRHDLALAADGGERVVLRESTITPNVPTNSLRGHSFGDLNIAVYAAATPNPADLILTSTKHLPLQHTTDNQTLTVGADKWLMVSTSRGTLVGSFLRLSPWLTLGVGLGLALLLASFVETLARRRTYALALVDARTLELRETLDQHSRLESEARRASAEATAANRSKSAFLSRMSHELRTPLNAVLGFAQLLEIDDLTQGQLEAVSQISKGGRHLLDLINEVLDISRIETGNITLSPEAVLAKEVLDESLDLMRPLASEHHIHLVGDTRVTCNVHVFADRQRLKQILLNMLSNAVKYNRLGGTVAVSCQVSSGRLRLRVSDTGPGIAPENLSRLFEPFERLGAEHTDIEGTGIGLALSRGLAEAMGGSIGVETAIGNGSTFWIELPVVEDPVARFVRFDGDLPAAAEPDGSGRHTILYIEDNLSNLRLIERLLARREQVDLVASMQGRLGIDLARQHHPSVILLDLHLPDIDGEEILARLREDPNTADIPVVILSADATTGRVQRLIAAGAHSYLTKPIDVRQLLTTIDGLLAGGNLPADNG
jgi:signal transduction histidine kinase/CheY-like chemotaxis protein